MSPNSTVLMDVECDGELELEGTGLDTVVAAYRPCVFKGEALVRIHGDTGRWTCPDCGTEHQIEGLADLGEPDPDLARKP